MNNSFASIGFLSTLNSFGAFGLLIQSNLFMLHDAYALDILPDKVL